VSAEQGLGPGAPCIEAGLSGELAHPDIWQKQSDAQDKDDSGTKCDSALFSQ
jgi:hypothetical protein